MLKIRAVAACLGAAVIFSSIGCGKKDETTDSASLSKEPVTLSLCLDLPSELSDDEINKYIREPLKKKLPHITLGEVVRNGKGTGRAEMIAAGNFPDLIYTTNLYIPDFRLLSLPQDLTPLAQKHGFDFNKTFDTVTVNTMNALSGGSGKIMGMPFSANWYATLYNKDIFDKFAVPYPKDLMSYEEALELSRKLTRNDGGTSYIGLDVRTMHLAARGLSLPLVDPVTMKTNFHTEAFRPIYSYFKTLFEIPGQVDNNGGYTWGQEGFFKTKNVAMVLLPAYASMLAANPNDNLNWDVTTALNFKKAIGTERETDIHILMMSSTSKHQDAAFQVMSLITSEEVQKEMARNGRVPAALQFPQFQADYAANSSYLKSKNWAGVFKAKRRELSPITEYHSIAASALSAATKTMAIEKKDINTFMMELQEKTDAAIAAEMARKKK